MRSFLLGVALVFAVGAIHAADGNKLLTACTAFVRYADAGNKGLDDIESMDASFCLGMMEGVSQTILSATMLANKSNQQNSLGTCLPSDGLANAQAARVVVRYLNERPDMLHFPGALLTLFALKTSFPCK